MSSYKDLKVWKKSYELVLKVYFLTNNFPRHEIFGLTSQMRRASVSIPSNIAEGNTRISKKDHIQFIRIAYGSGAELETDIEIAKDLKYISQKEYNEVTVLISEVMRMLNGLIISLSKV